MKLKELYTGNTSRLPDETDEQLRIRVKQNQLRKASITKLKYFLWKLGIKSAKSTGITLNTAFINTRVPGAYSNIKVIADAKL